MISISSGLKVLVAAALAASPTVTVAQACQGSRCVLPLQSNAPPPMVETAPAPELAPVEEVVVRRGGGISLPLLLLGALALGGLLYLLLNDNDDEESPASP